MPGSNRTPAAPGWRSRCEAWLERSWYRHSVMIWVLLPFTLVYRALLALRQLLYQYGLVHVERVNCVVVVVGNVIVGGAGKTPTVISLVQHLQQRGVRVGVVSRGYGRHSHDTRAVTPRADADQVGDEPLLIARATHAPVWVARDRVAGARALLRKHPDTQIIICDDGLQHWKLYRNLEICVFDDRGTGNGQTLPGGPLREPWPRKPLRVTGQSDATMLVLHTGERPSFAGYRAQRQLAANAVRADGTALPLTTIAAGTPVLALAGIARPERFFHELQRNGFTLAATLALPDHFDFRGFPALQWKDYTIVCTEKDAVKLWQHVPEAWAVPLLQKIEPAFYTQFDALVQPLLTGPVSSRHGHQTA